MAHDLRILIDVRMLMGRFSGVARMVTSLVDQLAAMPGLRVIALGGREFYPPWKGRKDIDLLATDFSPTHRRPARRLWWEATRLAKWIGQSGADVYHATWNSGVPRECPMPAVLTVHDVIPWDHQAKGLGPRFDRWCYRQSIRSSVRNSDRIVTVSGFTANQLVQKLRIDPERIRIIYNGAQAASTPPRVSDPSAPKYVLYVGGHEPRKNLQAVFRAIDHYWTHFDANLELRLTGNAQQLDPVARDVFENLTSPQRIRFLGSPTDAQLAVQYSNAAALIFLSRAEGFGLPALEAMAHGCPVIIARCGALPEIVGNAGILVDPDDPAEASKAISQVCASPNDLIACGFNRSAAFSWQRAAQAYFREYTLLAQTSPRPAKSMHLKTTVPILAPA